jgi:23S rRNA (uracil1939-C5)-methyltransferase
MVYTQPVKVGDIINIEIENIGEKGDGVGKYNDFVVIVPNGKIEEQYEIKIRKVFKTWALGDIMVGE